MTLHVHTTWQCPPMACRCRGHIITVARPLPLWGLLALVVTQMYSVHGNTSTHMHPTHSRTCTCPTQMYSHAHARTCWFGYVLNIDGWSWGAGPLLNDSGAELLPHVEGEPRWTHVERKRRNNVTISFLILLGCLYQEVEYKNVEGYHV